jgi:hypothetical protein
MFVFKQILNKISISTWHTSMMDCKTKWQQLLFGVVVINHAARTTAKVI